MNLALNYCKDEKPVTGFSDAEWDYDWRTIHLLGGGELGEQKAGSGWAVHVGSR
jgi:hypothetical protein